MVTEPIAIDNEGYPLHTGSMPVSIVNETRIAKLRHHGGSLLWPALGFIVLTAAAGFSAGFLAEPWMQITLWSAYALLTIAFVIVPWLRWLASSITITTHRVILAQGLLVRSRREILLMRVHDVTLRRSAGQMLFGSGDVLLGVGTEQPVRIHAVPRPNLVLAALTDLVHAASPRIR